MRYKPLGDTSKQRADCKKVSFVTQAIVICTVIVFMKHKTIGGKEFYVKKHRKYLEKVTSSWFLNP